MCELQPSVPTSISTLEVTAKSKRLGEITGTFVE